MINDTMARAIGLIESRHEAAWKEYTAAEGDDKFLSGKYAGLIEAKQWLMVMQLEDKALKPVPSDHLSNYRRDGECQGQTIMRRQLSDATQEELLEMIIASEGARQNPCDWFDSYYATDRELTRLKLVLKSEYHTDKKLRHAQHVADLEAANKKLRSEVREMQEVAERKNLELAATGMMVACTGCERGGPPGNENLTEEKVKMVERLARRLRTWWDNHISRKEREPK